jgi:hypothetical protein
MNEINKSRTKIILETPVTPLTNRICLSPWMNFLINKAFNIQTFPLDRPMLARSYARGQSRSLPAQAIPLKNAAGSSLS